MSVSIGNTMMRFKAVFEGQPFSSLTRNKDALSFVLAEKECEIKVGKTKDDEEVVVAEFPSEATEEPSARVIQVFIHKSQFSITLLFPPQSIDELAKEIMVPLPLEAQIQKKLFETYNFTEKSIELSNRQFAFQTSNVPCVNWLRKQLPLESSKINVNEHLNDEFSLAEDPYRLTTFSFVVHALPQALKHTSKSIQRKMETINKFEIQVPDSTDWEKGFANVACEIRDVKPTLFSEFLRHITD